MEREEKEGNQRQGGKVMKFTVLDNIIETREDFLTRFCPWRFFLRRQR